MEIECPECGKLQDVDDHLPSNACDDADYECRDCDHVFSIGWFAEVELR